MTDTTTRRYASTRENERESEEESEERRDEELVCPECAGNLVTDEERGETVCTECGLVVEEDEIDRMASALGLPENVRETASVIYRRALDEDLLPGRSIEGVATSALYAAARQAGTPRSLDEISAVSRVDKDEIARTYRYVVRELSLEIQPADPESYVPRFASDLDLPEEVERRARELLSTAKEQGVHSGKSPVGLAAAAVYAASLLANEKVTQSEVSEVANISEVTIRNRYHELLEAEEGFTPA